MSRFVLSYKLFNLRKGFLSGFSLSVVLAVYLYCCGSRHDSVVIADVAVASVAPIAPVNSLLQEVISPVRLSLSVSGQFPTAVDARTGEIVEWGEREWLRHDFHYDDVGHAILTLLAVSTGEGWPGIYHNSKDSTTQGLNGYRRNVSGRG